MYMNVFEDVYVAYADIVRQMKEPVVIINREYIRIINKCIYIYNISRFDFPGVFGGK